MCSLTCCCCSGCDAAVTTRRDVMVGGRRERVNGRALGMDVFSIMVGGIDSDDGMHAPSAMAFGVWAVLHM